MLLFPLFAALMQGVLNGADLQLQLYCTGFLHESCCGQLLLEPCEMPQLLNTGFPGEVSADFRRGVWLYHGGVGQVKPGLL